MGKVSFDDMAEQLCKLIDDSVAQINTSTNNTSLSVAERYFRNRKTLAVDQNGWVQIGDIVSNGLRKYVTERELASQFPRKFTFKWVLKQFGNKYY